MPARLWFLRWVVSVYVVVQVASMDGRAATPLAAVGFDSEFQRRGAESPPDQNRRSDLKAEGLDGAAERGRAIYWEGTRADGRALSAMTGRDAGVPLPARFTACVHCHGHDARGKTEGGVSASDIRGETLSRASDGASLGGRKRAAYDGVSFLGALARGIDSNGNPLDPRMPRYSASAEEAADVFTYLSQIARRLNPGVTDDLVRIGFSATKGAKFDAAMKRQRQLIAACFDEVNREGGIYRRQVELVDLNEPTPPNLKPAVLAIIAMDEGLAPTETAVANHALSASEKRLVPLLHVSAEIPCTQGSNDGELFSLFPGTVERARALIGYAMSHSREASRSVALVYSPKSVSPAVVEKIVQAAGSLATVEPKAIDPSISDEIVQELRTAGRDCVLLVGPPADFTALVARAQRLAWEPLMLWTEMPTELGTLPRAVSFQPNLLINVSVEAREAYSRWTYLKNSEGEHDLSRDLAIAGLARLVVETLKNAGRDLSGETFVATLQSAGEIRTGFVPPLLFAARRHIGSTGGYITPVSTSREQLPVQWISAD